MTKRKEPFLIFPSSLPMLTCAREHRRSPLRCSSHLNIPCCIYSVYFLCTFPSERNGTVRHRRNGMGSSGWLLKVTWLPVEDVQRALPIFFWKFPGVSQHLSLTLSLMRSSGGGVHLGIWLCVCKGVCSGGSGGHFLLTYHFCVLLCRAPCFTSNSNLII